jgi:hypothetical protein
MFQSKTKPKGWLAFELNVLRRLEFKSAAVPFVGEGELGAHLKRSGARVWANDLTHSGWTKAVAAIENNAEKLSEEDLQLILEDAYVPHHRLQNPALRNWFTETDSWWFDNVRANIERIASPVARAVALSLGMKVGDYVFSFTDETLELRQPLSNVFRRLWGTLPAPVDNGQNNACSNLAAHEFLTQQLLIQSRVDLLFLRLPPARNSSLREFLGKNAWREEWLRGGADFWDELEAKQANRLRAPVATKSQYLQMLEDVLDTAKYIPKWAIAHVDDGFVSTRDVVESVGRVRRVDTIFTKDFTELMGTKAVMITA